MKTILLYIAGFLMLSIGVNAQELKPSFEGMKTINGVPLYFKVIGEGKPLLIIHGGPGMSHDYFLPYLEPLAKKYKLILYDQRSSGRSAIPRDSLGASYRNMIDDIEAIRVAFKLDKLNILAHSWGNLLAINYALIHGDRVESLIINNSILLSHDFDTMQQNSIKRKWQDNAVNEKAKELKASTGAVTGIRMRLAFLPAFYDVKYIDSVNVTILNNFAETQNSLYNGLTSDVARYDYNYYPELKSIKAPVLVVHGDADNIPVVASETLQKSFTNAQLVRFDKAGHFPFIEERDNYLDAVRKFLDSVNKKK